MSIDATLWTSAILSTALTCTPGQRTRRERDWLASPGGL